MAKKEIKIEIKEIARMIEWYTKHFLKSGFQDVNVEHSADTLSNRQTWRGDSSPKMILPNQDSLAQKGVFKITTIGKDGTTYRYEATHKDGFIVFKLPEKLILSHELSDSDKGQIEAIVKLGDGKGSFHGQFSLEFANEALRHNPNVDFSKTTILDKNGAKCVWNEEGKFEPEKGTDVEAAVSNPQSEEGNKSSAADEETAETSTLPTPGM